MSAIQWVVDYLCVAALVAGGAVAFAAWSRGTERTTPAVTVRPALLAGALWPLFMFGLAQWLLVHVLAKSLRRGSVRTGEPVPDDLPRPKVHAS
ncbi:hypothetical protein ORI20_24555 [Mycobacterium sp. CVI_P3]|uniref:Uncharacterized protein n=1 Tax=Mycobacterium pinniadriaticum TaxID=2994102 RepID=A0ABT3SL53_9MYCO|nr:hypothetical protein [Mycobacterium pinniadriaticum]MCX2933448.1 hypothetical protein [Mycobacterium pinniadriaticum]MCX2939913.1 hypothetical protein [Mycobacterium pinniadriaticum]